ncbi:MAG: hypothetical protein JWM09_1350 [Francisellaceae bacterium]|nr:hypothetical protein [Francisellaceae bacterium]
MTTIKILLKDLLTPLEMNSLSPILNKLEHIVIPRLAAQRLNHQLKTIKDESRDKYGINHKLIIKRMGYYLLNTFIPIMLSSPNKSLSFKLNKFSTRNRPLPILLESSTNKTHLFSEPKIYNFIKDLKKELDTPFHSIKENLNFLQCIFKSTHVLSSLDHIANIQDSISHLKEILDNNLNKNKIDIGVEKTPLPKKRSLIPLASPTSPKNNRPFINILMVEDNLPSQKLLKRILIQGGLINPSEDNLFLANNGVEACNIFRENLKNDKNNIQLILMDIDMPLKNGLEATEEIRGFIKDKTWPIIIGISSRSQAVDIQKASLAGMNDYLIKPYEKNKLIDKVKKYSLEKKFSNPILQKSILPIPTTSLLDEFIAWIENELRNPLNILVRGSEELSSLIDSNDLNLGCNSYNEIDMLLHDMEKSIIHQINFVTQLDYLLKISSDKITLTETKFNTQIIIDEIINELKDKYPKLTIEYDMFQMNKKIISDICYFKSLIKTLLEDAYQVSHSSHLELKLQLQPALLGNDEFIFELGIIDRSMEIDPTKLKEQTLSFQRSSNLLEPSSLSLPIAQALAKVLGGELEVKSIQGQGIYYNYSLHTLAERNNLTPIQEEKRSYKNSLLSQYKKRELQTISQPIINFSTKRRKSV